MSPLVACCTAGVCAVARSGNRTRASTNPLETATPAKRRLITLLCISLLPFEFSRVAVLERELKAIVVRPKLGAEVLSALPLELAADHDIRRRCTEQVDAGVLSDSKVLGQLAIAVVDRHARVAERRG